jgi:ATP-dependent RNA circularization protein (DNA/RNA ligase family)
MSSSSFCVFPRTPHIGGSVGSGDDDAVVDQLRAIDDERETVLVEEKVDGANVSVHFDGDQWAPVLQKRSGLIETSERFAQYDVFRSWVFERVEALWPVLGTRFVLFGEFLFAQHAVPYNRLPDLLLVFDVFDKQERVFLSRDRITALLERIAEHDVRLHQVPLLQRGGPVDAERLEQLTKQQSEFGDEQREGVYVRIERDGTVLERFKFRRSTFVPGVQGGIGRDHENRNKTADE